MQNGRSPSDYQLINSLPLQGLNIFLLFSNHGTYFYGQLASLQILIGDTTAAINTTKSYFAKQYMSQIAATGEQVCVA
jgi:hypothetical protein